MAQIDSSIYSQIKSADLFGSFMDGQERGAKDKLMREDLEKKKKIDAAYQAGAVQNADGTMSYDGSKTLSALGGIQGAGREIQEYAATYQAQQAAQQKALKEKDHELANLIDGTNSAIKSAKTPEEKQIAYTLGIEHGRKLGHDVSKMDPIYGPAAQQKLDSIANFALTAKERSDKDNTQAHLDIERRKLGLEGQKIANSEGKSSGALEGRKALDKDYAKDYNDWTTNSRNAADKNLQRLREAKQALTDDKSLTGGVGGSTPDFIRNFTNEKAIVNRDKVRAAAQGALKATLGSAFTEKEGERIMSQAYNEKLSPEANIQMIDTAIREIEGNMNNADRKAAYFQKNGTLNGLDMGGATMQASTSPMGKPKDSPNQKSTKMVQILAPNGVLKNVPENMVEHLLQNGAKLPTQKAGY